MHLLTICILPVKVEETTREREERLKGWSTFLEGGDQSQKNSAPQPAGGATTPTPTTEERAELTSSTEPEQRTETEARQQEQEADSTDSSLAGSDEEEA